MGSDILIQGLLGPSAVTLIILAVIAFVQKLRENRTTLRAGYEAREQRRYEHAIRRLDAFQACAEAHLPWDNDVRNVVRELQYEVNLGRMEAGKPPRDFTLLAPAPPLFPANEEHSGD